MESIPEDEKRPRSKKTVVTKQEIFNDDGSDSGPKVITPSLFDSDDVAEKSIVRIRVYRVEPNEGMLDYLEDMASTEAALKERWGGSTYRLDGMNAHGRVQKSMTVKVAGDPIFVSQAAEIQWRRAKGMPAVTPGQIAAEKGMSFQEMLAYMQTTQQQQAKETEERETRRRDQDRQHAEMMQKLQDTADAKRREEDREREDRRRREVIEADERRRKDDAERDEKRRADSREAEQRQQQFMTQMLTMVQQSSNQALNFVKASATNAPTVDPMTQLAGTLKVIEMVKGTLGAGDDGPEDLLQTVIKQLPAMLSGGRDLITGVVREVRSTPGQRAMPAQPSVAQLLPLPPDSPLAPKVESLVGKLVAAGHDPEQALGQILDKLNASMEGKPVTPVVPTATRAPVQTVQEAGKVARIQVRRVVVDAKKTSATEPPAPLSQSPV